MEDYYIDEIPEIIRAWNSLHGAKDEGEAEAVETDPVKFFGGGGEVLA